MRCAFLLVVLPNLAIAHDAPTGWNYSAACCHNRDCRPVPPSTIKEGPSGYTVTTSGETIAYKDSRIKQSQDEQYHLCTIGANPASRAICLYVPLKGFWA